MRLLVLTIILTVLPGVGDLLSEAREQYLARQYALSTDTYLYSLSQYPQHARTIRYNIGLSYLRMDSLNQALNYLEQVSIGVEPVNLSSQAANHIGVILVRKGQYSKALEYFRQALIFDTSNEMARYNYELLSKRMLPPPGQSSPNTPPPPDSTENQDETAPEIDQETFEQLIREIREQRRTGQDDRGIPLGNDTLSGEEVLKIMEQMQQQPIQFLQQLRKKPIAAPSTADKPSW